jgi:hypothetical protein
MSTEDLRIGCCDPGVIGGVVIKRSLYVVRRPKTEKAKKRWQIVR